MLTLCRFSINTYINLMNIDTARRFLFKMVKENKEIQPILVKFGVALALSFAGFLYSRLKTRRISPSKPPLPPRPQSPLFSDHGNEIDSRRGRTARCDIHTSQAAPSCSPIVSDKHEDTFVPKVAIDNFSPLSRESGDKDRYLLPEFNELVKETNFSPRHAGISPQKENESPRSDSDTPKAYRSAEKEDYEQEIKHLRNMVRILREKERNLEVQLLEYYGLNEQETAVVELQNQLKINSIETKLFNLKIESLQADNRRLDSQVLDHNKVVAELESAKGRMKILKKKLRSEAEQHKEQILALQKRVETLQDYEHKKAGNLNDLDGEYKAERLNQIEVEVDELRKCKSRLQMENSELARRLESTQILASSILEVPDTEALKEMSQRLQKENEEFSKEVERLQADRCADVEELVYLRWINACLRYELRNYQPQSGKAVARDLSKILSPKSEEKAKQLIVEYATTEELGENGMNLTDLESDQWSSSQAAYLTDSGEFDESLIDNSLTQKTSTTKFFSRLRKLIRGKESGTHRKQNLVFDKATVEETLATYSTDSPNFSSSISTGIDTHSSSTRFTTPSQSSSRQSLDIQKIRRLNLEDSQRSSDIGSTFSYKRFFLVGEGTNDSPLENQAYQDSVSSHKSELVNYAEVLRHSRGSQPYLHKRSKSFGSC